MSFEPTSEQKAILSAARDTSTSMMITAYAGCGKTSTLELVANALPPKRSLALAFNVKIKKELERRFPAHFEVKTMNGLGHGAWMRTIGKNPKLDEKKLGNIITAGLKEWGNLDREVWGDIKILVSAAMARGLVPSVFPVKGMIQDTPQVWRQLADDLYLELPDEALDFAKECLIVSVNMGFGKGCPEPVISYDDQIYLPTMFNGQYPRFEVVLVDEAQDLSPLNHRQVAKVAGNAGRLIVCGDPMQAIYAFRGADSESMGKLRALRQQWIDLPLCTTFRCPKAVVERQQEHAPGFTAADQAPMGAYVPWGGDWSWEDLEKQKHHPRATVAIICRNNAPLLSLAMKLIKQGVGPTMLGRDIGKGLITLSKKLLPNDDTPSDVCIAMVKSWEERESQLATANSKEEKIAGITDRAECLIAVLERVQTARELRQRLEFLFSNERGQVTLSSGHRAKGLEWDVVLHLDSWRIPSKYAKSRAGKGDDAQLRQEWNLQYVIETRAKSVLVSAALDKFLEAE